MEQNTNLSIIKLFTKMQEEINNIDKELLIMKILVLCTKDEDQIQLVNFITNRKNELANDIIKYQKVYNEGDYRWLHNKILNDYRLVMELYKEQEEKINTCFRYASIIILNHKNEDELLEFYEKVKSILDKFENATEAAEYLIFHTGAELTDFMGFLIKYVKEEEQGKMKKFIPIKYLEEHQTILTLTLKEWIDIFNHLEYSLKYLTSINSRSYRNLKLQYDKLQLYYFIIISSRNCSRKSNDDVSNNCQFPCKNI